MWRGAAAQRGSRRQNPGGFWQAGWGEGTAETVGWVEVILPLTAVALLPSEFRCGDHNEEAPSFHMPGGRWRSRCQVAAGVWHEGNGGLEEVASGPYRHCQVAYLWHRMNRIQFAFVVLCLVAHGERFVFLITDVTCWSAFVAMAVARFESDK